MSGASQVVEVADWPPCFLSLRREIETSPLGGIFTDLLDQLSQPENVGNLRLALEGLARYDQEWSALARARCEERDQFICAKCGELCPDRLESGPQNYWLAYVPKAVEDALKPSLPEIVRVCAVCCARELTQRVPMWRDGVQCYVSAAHLVPGSDRSFILPRPDGSERVVREGQYQPIAWAPMVTDKVIGVLELPPTISFRLNSRILSLEIPAQGQRQGVLDLEIGLRSQRSGNALYERVWGLDFSRLGWEPTSLFLHQLSPSLPPTDFFAPLEFTMFLDDRNDEDRIVFAVALELTRTHCVGVRTIPTEGNLPIVNYGGSRYDGADKIQRFLDWVRSVARPRAETSEVVSVATEPEANSASEEVE